MGERGGGGFPVSISFIPRLTESSSVDRLSKELLFLFITRAPRAQAVCQPVIVMYTCKKREEEEEEEKEKGSRVYIFFFFL